ncbi:VanZ family protein [Streptomyces axinellae]|uniref:VanZ family protein n=1 Tax=Streptomyces axinellae TaxID=552788 RepID=UPI0031D5DDAF
MAGLILLAAHLCLVGWLTLRPLSVPWVAPSNLHPLTTIRADLAGGPRTALEGIGGGLLLLAPFGVLLPLATGRLHRPLPGTVARTIFAGAMVSALITLVQTGVPGQVVNVDSVLLNTTGVTLSAGLLLPLLRRLLRGRGGDAGSVGSAGNAGGLGGYRSPAAREASGVAGLGGPAGSGGMSGPGSSRAARPAGSGGPVVTGAARARAGRVRLREEGSQGPTPRATRVGMAP